ncbi:MAG: aspartyl-tRNA(Asn)/glutamyl-tRNA(Gln) amidotransferase subunit B, partial [Maricaulis maris]
GLSDYDAAVLSADKDRADYYEIVAEGRDAKLASSWVNNELYGRLNKEGLDITDSPVSATQLGGLIALISDDTISGKIAKDVFEILWSEGGDPARIVDEKGLKQVTDTGAIEAVIDQLIADNPDQAAQVKEKPKTMGWFVGQVMKAMQGKANPQAVNEILRKKLLG